MGSPIRWLLELGGEVVARIADAHAYEFPWTYGSLIDSPEFERFRPYFTDSETWPDDDLEMEKLCREIELRGGFVLRDCETGELRPNFWLNQNDDSVWFRIG